MKAPLRVFWRRATRCQRLALPLGLLLFSLGFISSSFSQIPQDLVWRAQSSGVLAKLSSVFFIDCAHGWAVGSNGTLLFTDNGGVQWRRAVLPDRQQKEPLNDLWFFDSERGCLLGEYNAYNRKGDLDWSERIFALTSGDGGANWQAGNLARPIPIRESDRASNSSAKLSGRDQTRTSEKDDDAQRLPDAVLLRMSFFGERVGWACGESGAIQNTRDGGATWAMQYSPTRKLLYDVAAIDQQQAWITGAGGTVLRTVDGGRNWNEQVSSVTQTLRAVHFIDAKRGWAVGSNGAIIFTVNGGNRWQAQNSGVNEQLNDVVFLNSKEGWIAADRGLLLHTRDGGATWEILELNTHANLNRLFFIAADCGWVVGANGAIFKYSA